MNSLRDRDRLDLLVFGFMWMATLHAQAHGGWDWPALFMLAITVRVMYLLVQRYLPFVLQLAGGLLERRRRRVEPRAAPPHRGGGD